MNKNKVLEKVYEEIEKHLRYEAEHGSNNWDYVRIHSDGMVSAGTEASRMVPESEYYSKPGAPITIWSKGGNREPWGVENFGYLESESGNYVADEYGNIIPFESLQDHPGFKVEYRFDPDYHYPHDQPWISDEEKEEIEKKLDEYIDSKIKTMTEGSQQFTWMMES